MEDRSDVDWTSDDTIAVNTFSEVNATLIGSSHSDVHSHVDKLVTVKFGEKLERLFHLNDTESLRKVVHVIDLSRSILYCTFDCRWVVLDLVSF